MPDTPAPHIDYTPPPGSHPFTDAERRQIYAHQGLQRLITANQRKGWMLQLVTRHGIAIDEASITTIRRIVHRNTLATNPLINHGCIETDKAIPALRLRTRSNAL